MIRKFILNINFFIKLIFFLSLKNFLYKRIFFSYQKELFIKKLILCLDCHKGWNYNLYPELYKIPIIKNQNREYLENSLISYKNFNRKSLYMNFITKDLNYLNIWYLVSFFCFKNEKYKR